MPPDVGRQVRGRSRDLVQPHSVAARESVGRQRRDEHDVTVGEDDDLPLDEGRRRQLHDLLDDPPAHDAARAGPDLPETLLEPADPDRSRGRQLHVPPREDALDRHDAAPAARQRGEEPDVGLGDDQHVLDVRGEEAVDTAAQLARQLEVTAIADGDDGDVAGVECLPHAGTVGRASAPSGRSRPGMP